MMSTNYFIEIEKFAENHFIKNFSKKYKKAWEVTLKALFEELQRFDLFVKTSAVDIINQDNNLGIMKVDFRVHGTNASKKASGNRCIVAVHKDIGIIKILLVYNKNDLGNGHETIKWKQLIKENYLNYIYLL